MATRIAETLLGAHSDMMRIHRRIVRVGAAAAWCAAALMLVLGFLTDNDGLYIEAVAPIIAAGFMTAQILLGRENGGVALLGSALVIMVIYTVVGDETTAVAAAVALVVICSIGTLVFDSTRMGIVGGISLTLFTIPLLWDLEFYQALQLGLVMALGFVMTSAIFFSVRNAATTMNVRYQTLFESSPSALIEEDWSEAIAYVRSEYTGRDDRVKSFLAAYPAVVRRAISKTKVTRVNQAAVDLLEADGAADLLGYRDGAALADESLEAYVDALVALFHKRALFEEEMCQKTMKGREVWLQTRSVDTSEGEPATTILVGLADITHIKARQDAMAELVRDKDEFVAKVSHELRTPLTAVLGLTSEMAAMEPMTSEEREEILQLVTNQASEMANIVEDLLVASRAAIGAVTIESRPVDLEVQLQTALDGVAVDVDEVPSSISPALADPNRVRQILRNLLTNAVRYGGPRRRILAGTMFDRVWIEVRDNGQGVPAAHADHIFEPYGTAHTGVSESVGLGLSVSRQLAELMNGSLSYYRDNSESIFRLELPADTSTASALASHSALV